MNDITLKIPDLPELKYIAMKFFIWGTINARTYRCMKRSEKQIVEEFEIQWKHERNEAWGLEGDYNESYDRINRLDVIDEKNSLKQQLVNLHDHLRDAGYEVPFDEILADLKKILKESV